MRFPNQNFASSLKIICCATFLIGQFGCEQKPLKPASWKTLEDEILHVVPQVLKDGKNLPDYTFDAPSMRKIRDKGTPDLWLEMARQKEFPLVSAAGFLCMEARKPEGAFEAGLEVLAAGSSVGNLSTYCSLPVIQYVKKSQPTAERLKSFSRIAQRRDLEARAILFLSNSLNDEFVCKWLEDPAASTANPRLLGWLVEMAIRYYSQKHEALPTSLAALLGSFENFSDSRGTVFLNYGKVAEPNLKDQIIGVLKNEQLDDGELYGTIRKYVDFISEKIPYRELGLPPKRIELIEKIKERHGKKKSE
jgi:hypothetical protein